MHIFNRLVDFSSLESLILQFILFSRNLKILQFPTFKKILIFVGEKQDLSVADK